MNEAETCRTLVRPKLEAAGWLANGERHFEEQIAITAGRVVVSGGRAKRQQEKIPDFLLCFRRDNPLAVVEAKSNNRPAADGLQQAKEYARILGLPFAYSTNGTDIIEYDAFTKQETTLAEFPPAVTLWQRYQVGLAKSSAVTDALLITDYFDDKKRPRYYQRIAIERAAFLNHKSVGCANAANAPNTPFGAHRWQGRSNTTCGATRHTCGSV